MINIDEVNFFPEVLNRKSWLKDGINWELFSMKYNGAISIIWAISSPKNYIAATLNLRIDSNTFIKILKMIDI